MFKLICWEVSGGVSCFQLFRKERKRRKRKKESLLDLYLQGGGIWIRGDSISCIPNICPQLFIYYLYCKCKTILQLFDHITFIFALIWYHMCQLQLFLRFFQLMKATIGIVNRDGFVPVYFSVSQLLIHFSYMCRFVHAYEDFF